MTRCPRGTFISREAALGKWMPLMLSWLHSGALRVSIAMLQEFCVLQARDEYRSIGRSADWIVEAEIEASRYQHRRMDEADKWLLKRDILARALAEIEAVK